ncbi:MAG: fumarate hydratase C-terminal domain-containing protein [Chloroflexi bacterium]|nr:fumarate hydratase C-terminal domain-containing protein [Chloroflexota bacterium]MCH7952992.1 fumarate hydratase C-terminal domain-containing protein [Chloroflexota bacterium]MCI0813728.1 fumarate hydratase C-terminal domain-containing protein [Chloroflexota bacterium]MCI0818347.1 fumarate hydratase C-terminal domain-containing protein [Chloroflexota bacterium]MCI0820608.1 fumarate hydratase C-terminal domain-containing protein [Chloroflexota bacterium]
MAEHQITLPLSDEVAEGLRAGDYAFLTGPVLTARDVAHKRMAETLAKGEPLPIDVRGEVIYYVGPTPPKPGQIIGSAGPTTAMRMDPFTIPLLEAGLKGAIGKGGRGPEVAKALQDYRAIYFLAVGGAGALLSRHIEAVEVVAYEDLGAEAMRRMQLNGFPVIVCNDVLGGDALLLGKAEWRRPD